jgi:acyl-[acyl carrier protein]--UDP-N-acetylglucosamine O-acyltransferase
MNAVVQFLPSGTVCFVVHFTALSVDMCCYVMAMAGLMCGELEIFGMKLS